MERIDSGFTVDWGEYSAARGIARSTGNIAAGATLSLYVAQFEKPAEMEARGELRARLGRSSVSLKSILVEEFFDLHPNTVQINPQDRSVATAKFLLGPLLMGSIIGDAFESTDRITSPDSFDDAALKFWTTAVDLDEEYHRFPHIKTPDK